MKFVFPLVAAFCAVNAPVVLGKVYVTPLKQPNNLISAQPVNQPSQQLSTPRQALGTFTKVMLTLSRSATH